MLPDNSRLFPPAPERLQFDRQLGALLAEALLQVKAGPVSPDRSFASYALDLAEFDFESPIALDRLAEWSVAKLRTGLVQLNHPRYLGLFNPSPSFPAQCADRIVSAFNPQLASAKTSPVAVAIEAHVIRAVAKRAGMAAAVSGHFTSGGSEANATALICALTDKMPEFSAIGSRAFPGQPVFYISNDAHLVWIKIAHQAGIGRYAARMVPTDGAGRMLIPALNDAIQNDRRAGAVPFMVVATAGTTNAGIVDPMAQCAEIARREGLWYHVDAAWGGGVIASDRHRHYLAGIEAADSVTIDAHKWFATTMGCGMILVAKPNVLAKAFGVVAGFMPSQAADIDPYVTSMQWSRRFTGLRLFFSLAAAGWAGHAAHVERAFMLVDRLVEALRHDGWSRVNGSEALAVACLKPPHGSRPVHEIVAAVVHSGVAWVSVASFEESDVIRVCVTHGETSSDDIVKVAEALQKAGCGESATSLPK